MGENQSTRCIGCGMEKLHGCLLGHVNGQVCPNIKPIWAIEASLISAGLLAPRAEEDQA